MTLDTLNYKNQTFFKLTIILFLSYFVPSLNLDIGFALKPYMVIMAVILFFWFSNLKIHKLNSNEILMLTFYIYYMFTIIFSDIKEESIRLFFAVIINIVAYFVLRYGLLNLTLSYLKKLLYTSGLIYNLLSLFWYLVGVFYVSGRFLPYGVYFGVLNDGNMIRLVGLHTDPNFFALSNFLFLHFYLSNISYKKSKLLFGITLLNMLLTISRGGYLVIIASLLMYLFINFSKAIKYILILLIVGILSYGIFYFIFHLDIFALVQSRFGIGNEIDISGGRLSLSKRGIAVLLQSPLFGSGIYSAGYLINLGSSNFQNLHNTYLEVFIESGIIGGLTFVSFIGTLIYSSIATFHDKDSYSFVILNIISVFIMIASLSAITSELLLLNILITNVYIIKSKVNERSADVE